MRYSPLMSDTHPILSAIAPLAKPDRIADFSRYFQNYEGGYGERDVFIGVMVPDRRAMAKANAANWSPEVIATGLHHKIHEVRHTALFALLRRYGAERGNRQFWHDLLCDSFEGINNWDLVDTCAHVCLGRHAFDTKNDSTLTAFLGSSNVWKRRAAVVSQLWFLKNGEYEQLIAYAPIAAENAPDILQKGIGWLLKILWQMDPALAEAHLSVHFKSGLYSRLIVRIALEKTSKEFRKDFMMLYAP